MSQHHSIQLGVNVDHIATLRQARGTTYPDPQQAADIARKAGADGITVHLREDRRHIQDADVRNIRDHIALPLNLEMAATAEMLAIARKIKPAEVCLVPEKRQELTTEGGLDVLAQEAPLKDYIAELKESGARISLFIDAELSQIEASVGVGAEIVEIHTGHYAEAKKDQQGHLLEKIVGAARTAKGLGLQVNAGHGLHYQNVQRIAAIEEIAGLNIGHSIIARATISGMYEAVFAMKQMMINARLKAEGVEVP